VPARRGIQVSEAEIAGNAATSFAGCAACTVRPDTKQATWMRCASALEEFEAFITDSHVPGKDARQVCSEQAALGYFKLNSPTFDSIEVSHIVLDSEAKAKEMVAVLGDDPDSFDRDGPRALDRGHPRAGRV